MRLLPLLLFLVPLLRAAVYVTVSAYGNALFGNDIAYTLYINVGGKTYSTFTSFYVPFGDNVYVTYTVNTVPVAEDCYPIAATAIVTVTEHDFGNIEVRKVEVGECFPAGEVDIVSTTTYFNLAEFGLTLQASVSSTTYYSEPIPNTGSTSRIPLLVLLGLPLAGILGKKTKPRRFEERATSQPP